MALEKFVSIGKLTYRWPLSQNHQDILVYWALKDSLACRRIYLIVQNEDSCFRVSHVPGIIAIYIPRLAYQAFNHLWFVLCATLIGTRLMRKGITVFQASDTTGGGLAGTFIKAMGHVSLLVNLQGDFFNLPPLEFSWWRRAFASCITIMVCRVADKVRCVSHDLLRKALRAGIKPDKLVFVPSRCDTQLFDPARAHGQRNAIRERWAVSRDAKVLLFVGTLSVHKGITFLLKALPSVLHRHRDAVLLLVGSGQSEATLREQAKALGIVPSIRFCGRVPYTEIPTYMSSADIFVLSSLDEGMPRVILEAMAMQLPVVASRVGGVPELVEQGDRGLLVEPGNSEQLADAILYVLDNLEEARRWGVRARGYVEANYSFERGICAYAAVLSGLVGQESEVGRGTTQQSPSSKAIVKGRIR